MRSAARPARSSSSFRCNVCNLLTLVTFSAASLDGASQSDQLAGRSGSRGSLRFDPARQQPKRVRETIEVNDDLFVAQLARLAQGAHTAFGAAAGGARHVK